MQTTPTLESTELDSTCDHDVSMKPAIPIPFDLYSVGHEKVSPQLLINRREVPFKHQLLLHGLNGEVIRVQALFDGGAMVSAMDTKVFNQVRHRLGGCSPSRKPLRMADGALVVSQARWNGVIEINGVRREGEFEVFDSGGGWAFLFGKPLLRAFNATHNFASDEVQIKPDGPQAASVTLRNTIGIIPIGQPQGVSLTLDVKQWELDTGGSSGMKPPSRQVLEPVNESVLVQNDKLLNPDARLLKEEYSLGDSQAPHLGGSNHLIPPLRGVQPTVDILTYQDLADETYASTIPELPIVATCSEEQEIFTRHTEPFNPKRVEHILGQVAFGDDLTSGQLAKVKAVIAEHADCFALSLSEVNAIPGAVHKLNIPLGSTFRTKIPQRAYNPDQRSYMGSKVDEMLEAGIIEQITPGEVRCVAPTVLAQKAHEGGGLLLDELKHRVNDECIRHGLPPSFDMPPRPPPDTASNPIAPKKWRICQDFHLTLAE